MNATTGDITIIERLKIDNPIIETNSQSTERETIRNHTNTATTNKQTTTQTNGQAANTNSTASSSKNITQDQAISIAKQRASGTVTKVEYERDENKYEITIRNGRIEHDFEINARTGAIISYETDYDD